MTSFMLKQTNGKCRNCKIAAPISFNSPYCSFKCCFLYSNRPYGKNGCMLDRRAATKFDGLSLSKKSAAWFSHHGVIVHGKKIINSCETSGCIAIKHLALKEEYNDSQGKHDTVVINPHDVAITLFIDGKSTPAIVTQGPIPFKSSMHRFSLTHRSDNGHLISVVVELPLICEIK